MDTTQTIPTIPTAETMSNVQSTAMALFGPAVFLCCLIVSTVLFAAKNLCSLSRTKTMGPLEKVGHALCWGWVVPLGLIIVVVLLSQGLYYLMTRLATDTEPMRLMMGLVTKSTLRSLMGVLMCGGIVSMALIVFLPISRLEREFDAIDVVAINAAVQFVALVTWTARMQ